MSNRYLNDRQIRQKNATLEGVVVNNFIKDEENQDKINLDDTFNTLLIRDKEDLNTDKYIPQKNYDRTFDTKKAMVPLLTGAGIVFASSALLGIIMKKSAQKITTEPLKNQLPPMGLNLNIVQEPEFSTYMALRDPTPQNVFAMISVFAFSAITLMAKKFVEGVKEIWIKKQDATIQRDLQEDLIQVETEAFSGKLAVVREMLSEKGAYLKNSINSQNAKNELKSSVFSEHFSFKGADEQKSGDKPVTKILNPYTGIIAGVVALGVGAFALTFKNFKKSSQILDDYAKNFINRKERILKDISDGKIENPKNILADTLKKTGATADTTRAYAEKIGLSGNELEDFVQDVASDVKNIWGNAPTGMSTESGKSFFYCYLNEPRGHLYNWLIHSDNIFLKYLFLALTTVCGTSYLAQQGTDAIKQAAVLKENAKTELGLQKRLVSVEIQNFRAKKESAIAPLIEEFERKRKEGKTPSELKVMADNILLEIKNGPPFVYS